MHDPATVLATGGTGVALSQVCLDIAKLNTSLRAVKGHTTP